MNCHLLVEGSVFFYAKKIYKTFHLQKKRKPLSIKFTGQIEITPLHMIYAKDREKQPIKVSVGPQKIIRYLWWVVLFVFISSFVYTHAAHKKNEVITSLNEHLGELNKQKTELLQEREDLLLHLDSQSDPAWIQLTLMKGLGLVPEGQLKVYFYGDNE